MVPYSQIIRNDLRDFVYRFPSRTTPETGVVIIGVWARQIDFTPTFEPLECGRRYVANVAKTVPSVVDSAATEVAEH
jgi:hypothetical protein